MSLTEQNLSELRRLEAEATGGPWRSGRSDMVTLSDDRFSPCYKNIYVDDPRGGKHFSGEPLPFVVGRGQGDERECIANAALIVALRNAARDLIEAAEEREAAVKAHANISDELGKTWAERDALLADRDRWREAMAGMVCAYGLWNNVTKDYDDCGTCLPCLARKER